MALSPSKSTTEIDYPSSDGQPMAESDFQRTPLLYRVEALRIFFRARSDVYVLGNMFIYYEEGNPRAAVALDVFVVIGADNHDRASYRLWQEPKAPDWAMEITSKRTQREDQITKRRLYAQLGVREYWQYDPTGDYLVPQLQGLQLIAGEYQPLTATRSTNDGLAVRSEVLGLDLTLTEDGFRFVDPATGHPLLSYLESEQARQKAEQARQEADARIAALEAQLRRLQGDK